MTDPVERFRWATAEIDRIQALHRGLAATRARCIDQMRQQGMRWHEIEAATGMSRSRLNVIWGTREERGLAAKGKR